MDYLDREIEGIFDNVPYIEDINPATVRNLKEEIKKSLFDISLSAVYDSFIREKIERIKNEGNS